MSEATKQPKPDPEPEPSEYNNCAGGYYVGCNGAEVSTGNVDWDYIPQNVIIDNNRKARDFYCQITKKCMTSSQWEEWNRENYAAAMLSEKIYYIGLTNPGGFQDVVDEWSPASGVLGVQSYKTTPIDSYQFTEGLKIIGLGVGIKHAPEIVEWLYKGGAVKSIMSAPMPVPPIFILPRDPLFIPQPETIQT